MEGRDPLCGDELVHKNIKDLTTIMMPWLLFMDHLAKGEISQCLLLG